MYVDKSKTYVGLVEENIDPKKLGRCRVRVIDIFDEIPVDDIPWASPWKDLNGNSFNVPEKGKVVTIVFDSGNIYKPEYIYSEHYNINLENKLQKLSGNDYTSMKSLIFDHKTQIYVNDSEGLKIDHKYNNLNIKEKTINLNLKDNTGLLNLGDETAGQQAILGNHWLDWFDQFVDNLLGMKGGPYLGNQGAVVTPNPSFIAVLQAYKQLRDPVFLSSHVKIVDNNQVTTVRTTERENKNQLGDKWRSTKRENDLVSLDSSGNYSPTDNTIQPDMPDDPNYVAPPTDGSPDNVGSDSGTFSNPSLSDVKSNPKIDKMVKFLKSKGYAVYDKKCVLNIVGMRNPTKDNGSVSNKFDDTLYVFYVNENGNWMEHTYHCTVVPGYDKGTKQIGSNRAVLQLGQYIDQYKLGFHQNNQDHKCLKFATSVVHRNNDSKKYNYSSRTEKGGFGINIHRSGNPQGNSVFNYSEGCQVFKEYAAWNQFIRLCEKQENVTNKKTFTYTLIKQSEYNSFIYESDVLNSSTPAPVGSATSTDTNSTQKTPEQISFDEFRKIVKIIENIYRLGDNNFMPNGTPLFKDYKSTFGDDEQKAVDRLYELLGLKTTTQTWYNKLPLTKLTSGHKDIFMRELGQLKQATLKNLNTYKFLLPTLKTGEGQQSIIINPDF